MRCNALPTCGLIARSCAFGAACPRRLLQWKMELPNELRDKVYYELAQKVFFEMDLDWRDVEDAVGECASDDERTGVLVRWMDQEAWCDDWKADLPADLLQKHSTA